MGRHKKQNKEKEDRPLFVRPELGLSSETKRGVSVVVFLLLGCITLLASVGKAGNFGNLLMDFLKWLSGVLAYIFPFVMFLVAILLSKHKIDNEEERDTSFYLRVYLGTFLLFGAIAGAIHIYWINLGQDAWLMAAEGQGGGYIGGLFGWSIYKLFNFWAGMLVLVAFFVIGLLVALNISLKGLWKKNEQSAVGGVEAAPMPKEIKINAMGKAGFVESKVIDKNPKIEPDRDEPARPQLKPKVNTPQTLKTDIKLEPAVLSEKKDWKLPPFDLLEEGVDTVDSGNIELNVAIIKKTLSDFGIEVEMGEVNVGPTVTQYTLRPSQGIKLSQIAALSDNLALELAAKSIRMELPIPGKSLVGVEVPNKVVTVVKLKDVVKTNEFINSKSKLIFALGRDVAGMTMLTDLAKMPHLLIAGATNKGKSVCINSLFVSLLYRNTPDEVKFIVIDPKKVELNLYNGIPHLLTPVVTEYEKAVNSLKWAVSEMDRRYKLLAESHKRNISEYNESAPSAMPYIVILVDELADLMAVAQADVEAAIVRLAQMARAVGIHLVVATQRPSVDIITGLIKANITARIAFATASQIDSRTILDTSGAEKLLGNGDMLYMSAEYSKPKRIQGAYIGEKEIKKVTDFFRQQAGAVIYNEEILEKPKKLPDIPGWDEGGGEGDDPLLEDAAEEVRRAGKASASLLQRRLRLGYARAARILDQLEQKGIVGPGEGAKPREVYGISQAERSEYGSEESEHEV